MISITEIVLIVAGFAAIILGYLLPAGKEMDEEDKMLMEREIRELVRREVEDQKETIENMVDDTVDNSLDRTERAMERISNEKMSAIGEYSHWKCAPWLFLSCPENCRPYRRPCFRWFPSDPRPHA